MLITDRLFAKFGLPSLLGELYVAPSVGHLNDCFEILQSYKAHKYHIPEIFGIDFFNENLYNPELPYFWTIFPKQERFLSKMSVNSRLPLKSYRIIEALLLVRTLF